MPETYMQVCAFCRLAGHCWRFIKGFANIVHPLYDVLRKEVKMGPVDLPPEAQQAVDILKRKVQSTPGLVFPCKVLLLTIQWRLFLHFICLVLLLQLCQRFLLLWLCSNVLRLLGNVVRVYPRIVQGLTFLSA